MIFRMKELPSAEEVEEQRIVAEFVHLFEKSKQLFNGLRDLPPYGHKQWQTHFGRAFDVYTRLWKFQQQNRSTLDKKYTLKRSQIGEIASRIGQLYYSYYLRTSDTNYLNEAFQFYGAIRARGYFSKKEERSELVLKRFRYYARFIVVCLMLRRLKNVRELAKELSQQLEDAKGTIDTHELQEWGTVVSEIRSFLEGDSPVSIFDTTGENIILNYRLTPLTLPPIVASDKLHTQMNLHLQEVLIVGSKNEQWKFSELTMDMYRIAQTLERALQDEQILIPCLRRENPHKYLLYKPTFENLLIHLSSAFKDLETGGVLLLYISGEPIDINDENMPLKPVVSTVGFDKPGIALLRKEESRTSPKKQSTQANYRRCLHLGDLISFTRKPLFLIIESENAQAFGDIRSPFDSPLLIFIASTEIPYYIDNPQRDSLMTLFLHCPLTGFCVVTGIDSLTLPLWETGQSCIEKFMGEASRTFVEISVHDTFIEFFGDDFLRLLILRFLFYQLVLKYNEAFQNSSLTFPRSFPQIHLEQFSSLTYYIQDLARSLSVDDKFNLPNSIVN